ncbi:prolyl-tRNA synthetase [Purpureocillium lavendulum]|uniref:proline--tRNA ligase n=1 Tax=Purpureocillium lavendulum TaxID=1247861 RepID=A0AB34G347_9HYPO|nr:prolyl-tRNA synthetase [Purpureocillium lavendulum]
MAKPALKSQSGIFQLLPLGLRVQQKIESLLDKHMQSIADVCPKLFRLKDRKETDLLLSPTHEEEITTLVASTLKSYKDLPLRLYQTTRKYRDEMRPRHGLLRSREFVMKDLYTFDTSVESAIETYREVSGAYRAFFANLKLPVLVAEASSGDMGGDYSHEYHLASSIGEDTVAECSSCGYVANDEVAKAIPPSTDRLEARRNALTATDVRVWRGITKDRRTLVNAWYPAHGDGSGVADVNVHAVKEAVPELDASISDPIRLLGPEDGGGTTTSTFGVLNVVDARLASSFSDLQPELPIIPAELTNAPSHQSPILQTPSGEALNLLRLADGDVCSSCKNGTLQIHRALELGHTFYLGTRYSEPLELSVSLPNTKGGPVPVQMGCYGIGVSRIFGAVAEHKADERGLNWPRAIAPFEVAVIPTSGVTDETLAFYDSLAGQGTLAPDFDIVLDDRKETFGWKMRDADVIGYPVTVVLGKSWRERGICEVQCRTLGVKENVAAEDVPAFLRDLLDKLSPTSSPSPSLRPQQIPPTSPTMSGGRETINLDTLEPQQLAQVKKQLDEELEHLTSSFAQLHGAQNKFRDCLRCVNSRSAATSGASIPLLPIRLLVLRLVVYPPLETSLPLRSYSRPRRAQPQDCISQRRTLHKKRDVMPCTEQNSVLVPLTNSLYVRGELTDSESVLVDVGTGFLVEKKLKSAEQFYDGKVQELANNLKELEAIVQQKQANVRAVEEGMAAS